jgi:hypothetical protein
MTNMWRGLSRLIHRENARERKTALLYGSNTHKKTHIYIYSRLDEGKKNINLYFCHMFVVVNCIVVNRYHAPSMFYNHLYRNSMFLFGGMCVRRDFQQYVNLLRNWSCNIIILLRFADTIFVTGLKLHFKLTGVLWWGKYLSNSFFFR